MRKVALQVKSSAIRPSFSEVIDREVEEYVACVGAARFDKCEVELRILATPEFRRVHAIQVEFLEDIDLETPIIDFMRKRVHSDLNQHVGLDGKRDLVEVLADSTSGDRFTWYRLDGISTSMLQRMLQALIEDEERRPVERNAARIARLKSLIQEREETEP